MKKIICLMLITVGLIVSLVGCALVSPKENDENVENNTQIEEVVDETTDEAEEVVEETDKEVEEAETEVEDETTDTTTAEVSSDWKSYQFVVDGQTLTLPCTYEELKAATGYTYKSADEKSYLASGYYTLLNMYNADEKLSLYVESVNNTEDDVVYTELPITRVSQSAYQVENNNGEAIVFPGGLKAGQSMTVEEVKALFGEPTKFHDYIDGDYESYTLTYCEDEMWTTMNHYEIVITNGIIDQLTLDNR